MSRPNSFADVVAKWPTVAEMSRDMQLEYDTIRKWKERDNIPATNWFELLRAAKRRKIALSAEDLILLARNGAKAA